MKTIHYLITQKTTTMKTLSLFFCLFLVAYGLYFAVTNDFVTGSIVLILGGLSFVIISHPVDKNKCTSRLDSNI